MPIYEYECQTCGQRIEALQKVNDPPLESCSCGDEGKLRKLISAPAFQFKGDGWYVTDYARKGNGKEKKEEGGEKKEAKGEGKGKETKESKGAEKGSDTGGKTKPERTST